MILHRFCSVLEYNRYCAGEVLHNNTDHYHEGRGGSTSRGFCFFQGNHFEWARRLNGLVDFDILLSVNVAQEHVRQSMGVYADWETAPDGLPYRRVLFPEFCTESYDITRFRFVCCDRSFAHNPRYVSHSALFRRTTAIN